jgi:hypothetical protein
MSGGTALMAFAALEATLEDRRLRVEAALKGLWTGSPVAPIAAAVEDSLFAPAKRLRPIVSLLVAEVLRGDPEAVVPAVVFLAAQRPDTFTGRVVDSPSYGTWPVRHSYAMTPIE